MMYHIAFVCIDNSCRSQMAKGWFNYYSKQEGHEQIQIYSAGILTQPIHPYAIEVMKERDIDISHHLAKSVFALPLNRLTHLITVCERTLNTCPPSLFGVSYSHWDISDPLKHHGSLEERYAIFQAVRDQIDDRVRTLIDMFL